MTDKKEKSKDMEEMQQYHMCPMLYQCPMSFKCPMFVGHMPIMPMQNMPDAGMKVKDWHDNWDEYSEDSSFEFDSDDFLYPEKYYNKLHKKHRYPYCKPASFPFYK